MTTLRAAPGAGVTALAGLVVRAGGLRHPLLVRDAARIGLPGVIRLAAARHPEVVVLHRGSESITAAQLDAEVRQRSAALTLPPGARVGVRSDGGIPYLVTLAAALDAGLDAVPLGARLSPADVATLGLDEILEPERASDVGSPSLHRRPARPAGRLLLLTTGTTGAPLATSRGRMGIRAAAQLADADRRIGLPSDGPLLLLAPPDHGHGLSAIVGTLLRGTPVVLGSGLTPGEQVALVRRHHPASISGVPAQLARLLDAASQQRVLVPARVIVSGSSPLSPTLRARLESGGTRVHDGFGATATGTVAIDGRPLAGVLLRRKADGSLAVRSPLGGQYWVATGDLVEVVDGRVVPAGRTGALIDSGGELLDPSRLHQLLTTHPGVTAADVQVVPDDLLGAVLHARVDGDPALEPLLRAAIADRLGRAEHPRRLEFGALPAAERGR